MRLDAKSFVISSTFVVLRMGIMTACFHLIGAHACYIDVLKIEATGKQEKVHTV
jgi:hypothetical protein